ncbi:MAG TPA: hypothetical protein V6D14_25150 [Coleofasciculaceae cyanobacterium]
MITNFEAYELSVEQREEAAILERVPRAKNLMGDAKAPAEWYTPPEYIEMARAIVIPRIGYMRHSARSLLLPSPLQIKSQPLYPLVLPPPTLRHSV